MRFLHPAPYFQAKMELSIYLTNNQYMDFKVKVQMSGFNTISAFVRDRLFRYDCDAERKIREVHRRIIQNGKKQKNQADNNTSSEQAS